MKIAIVDDSIKDREYLQKEIQEIFFRRNRLPCHYNMDTNRWKPGSRIALCCIKQWMPNDSILS